jgi:RNase H-fold protein (predicted Holliday junction resolvase)
LVEINQLFVVQEFVGIGDVSRHGIGFALGAHSRFIVHPLEFVDNFRENAADIFDHLVHRLAGRLFEIFADVHGANGIAKTVKTKKEDTSLVNKKQKQTNREKSKRTKWGGIK